MVSMAPRVASFGSVATFPYQVEIGNVAIVHKHQAPILPGMAYPKGREGVCEFVRERPKVWNGKKGGGD